MAFGFPTSSLVYWITNPPGGWTVVFSSNPDKADEPTEEYKDLARNISERFFKRWESKRPRR